MNKYLKNFFLVIFIVTIALLIVEGLSRLVFDPIDFLMPKRVPDEILGYKLEPKSGAHDSWGYRNKFVPDKADIVAIGDSHTYGISATASNSWPSILQELTGVQIYNISLGGYGPADYLYLMKEKAFRLNPKIIIVGLYLGNDLKNTFADVYSVPIWKDLRDPDFQFNNSEDDSVLDKSRFSIRKFLAEKSVMYRIISSSFIGDYLRQKRRISQGEEIIMYSNKESDVITGFTPDKRLKGLNLNDPEVAEGLRLTLEILNRMDQISKENNVEFLVLIIPTKESVFSKLILESNDIVDSAKINLLIKNEKRVNQIVKNFLNQHSIQYIDVLDPLRAASEVEQLYPKNFGGHSNKNGYRVFAETIYQHLSTDKHY